MKTEKWQTDKKAYLSRGGFDERWMFYENLMELSESEFATLVAFCDPAERRLTAVYEGSHFSVGSYEGSGIMRYDF